MSLYDYQVSRDIAGQDPPFYGILMAAIRQADTANTEKIRAAWPEVYAEFEARYHARGGRLPGDDTPRVVTVTETTPS